MAVIPSAHILPQLSYVVTRLLLTFRDVFKCLTIRLHLNQEIMNNNGNLKQLVGTKVRQNRTEQNVITKGNIILSFLTGKTLITVQYGVTPKPKMHVRHQSTTATICGDATFHGSTCT